MHSISFATVSFASVLGAVVHCCRHSFCRGNAAALTAAADLEQAEPLDTYVAAEEARVCRSFDAAISDMSAARMPVVSWLCVLAILACEGVCYVLPKCCLFCPVGKSTELTNIDTCHYSGH